MGLLIVDDLRENRFLLQRVLQLAGYADIHAAGSASEAFSLLGIPEDTPRAQVDLILMDIGMAEMDGVEACRVLKADLRYRDVPVLMVTARTEGKDLAEAFAAGASDYITKPIDRHVLLARVRHALRLKEEIDQRKAREIQLLEAQSALEAVNAKLQDLVACDGLTGIPNRRRWDEVLQAEWRRAIREHSSLAVLLGDIDQFKRYNDRYGHLAGDDCLRSVARGLQSVMSRGGDVVARYGGEEFAVLLPTTDEIGASIVAEKLRAAIASLSMLHEDSPAGVVTISFGVTAHVPGPADRITDLLQTADAALYRAKRAGGNRVWVAEPETPAPEMSRH